MRRLLSVLYLSRPAYHLTSWVLVIIVAGGLLDACYLGIRRQTVVALLWLALAACSFLLLLVLAAFRERHLSTPVEGLIIRYECGRGGKLVGEEYPDAVLPLYHLERRKPGPPLRCFITVRKRDESAEVHRFLVSEETFLELVEQESAFYPCVRRDEEVDDF